MISPARISLPESFGASGASGPDLVEQLLADQHSLTAVERFSALHDSRAVPAHGLHRDLIPLNAPGPGEQYAFEVDLDRCTGCKACVTACHSMNGLNENETWRSVGLLQKVSMKPEAVPAQQHVTTACHHCLEPGCAQGCPTLAYEKDPATGIVKHLDDQCFGCQYCVLKCPYDVPQYNPKRGIVRKCDLCVGRLREGEAPACAQACPTQAIRVTVVETAVVRAAPAGAFDLPDAPDPVRVMPTTRYVSKRGLQKGLSAADAAQIKPEHAHLPLVLMLVISQAVTGYLVLLTSAHLLAAWSQVAHPRTSPSFPWAELAGVAGVQLFLALSLLHLGRPWLAWKAVLGWRRSWLSREVIAFSALAGSTGSYAVIAVAQWWGRFPLPAILALGAGIGVLLCAAAALHASAMVYRDTPRALWATRATLWRFALTAALCGIPAFLLASGYLPLLLIMPILMIFKLLLETSLLRHRDDEDFNPLWKGAQLLFGVLRPLWLARVALGLLGGIVLPVVIFPAGLSNPVWIALTLIIITVGELLERHLFFTTAVAPRMPGGRS